VPVPCVPVEINACWSPAPRSPLRSGAWRPCSTVVVVKKKKGEDWGAGVVWGVVGHWSAAAAAAAAGLPLQMLKEKMGRERVKKTESGRCGRRAQ
jgi:hypothetical protein